MVGNANSGPRSEYDPEYAEIAREMCEDGATDQEVWEKLGISKRTFYTYRLKYPDFSDALNVGKAPADENVKASLYKRANGYEYMAQEILVIKGEIHIVEVRKHVPPDTTAGIFWMKNRDRVNWNWDRHKPEPEGSEGNTLVIKHSPDAD